jgi:glycosyltransferase involved in cell wall biosynthesis
MRIKVLFSLYRSGNFSNGGVISLLHIANNNKIVPYFVSNDSMTFNTEIESIGKSYTYPIKSISIRKSIIFKLWSIIYSNCLVSYILIKNKISILHCNDLQGFWHAYFGAFIFNRKIILNIRDVKTQQELNGLWKWKLACRLSDEIIVLSESMKEFLLTQNISNNNSNKISSIYSIVDFNRFKPSDNVEKHQIRSLLNIPTDKFLILYVGVFNLKKAQLLFLENVVPVFKNKNILFVFVGDFNPEEDKYSDLCLQKYHQLELENTVKFVRFDKRIENWYRCSDLNVLASQKEGLARCMIEGLTCGLPMISFDVTSAKEILETNLRCGYVINQGDYQGFIIKINSLISNTDLLKEFSLNAIEFSKTNFTNALNLDKYYNIYQKLCK